MSKLSIFKKAAALSLVSLMAAASVPTAASGVEDNPSDSITVGVVIDQEPNECTSASLTVNGGNPDLTTTYPIDRDQLDPSELSAWNLILFSHRASVDPIPAFALELNILVDEVWQLLLDNPGDFPLPVGSTSIVDLDGDGVISVPDDIPSYFEAQVSSFHSDDFVVAYDAGDCSNYQAPLYGLLSVDGNPLYKLDETIDDWLLASITDFDAENLADYNGKGGAYVFMPPVEGGPVSSSEIDFGHYFAEYERSSMVSFAQSGTETLKASIDIHGTETIGRYRVAFDFNLEVGDESYMVAINNQFINCFFDETRESCVG